MPKTKCLAVRCGAHHSLLFDPATHFSLHGNDQGASVSCDELRDSETFAGYHLLKIILESARDFPGLLCAPIHLCAGTCVHERGHACGCAGESLSHVTNATGVCGFVDERGKARHEECSGTSSPERWAWL